MIAFFVRNVFVFCFCFLTLDMVSGALGEEMTIRTKDEKKRKEYADLLCSLISTS